MNCSACSGSGEDVWDEDGRQIVDVCRDCGGTGECDQEVKRQQELQFVASELAYRQELECKKACNEDPEGEGYVFRAAENMMSAGEYFQSRVWDRYHEIAEKLAGMDPIQQDVLLAWAKE